MSGHALVVGATGITGNAAVERLANRGWEVHGLCRKPPTRPLDGVEYIYADLTDRDATREVLRGLDLTHVFFCSWSRQPTEAENCTVNGAMLRHALEAVEPAPRHVALVTGLKHYLGPFEAYAQAKPETPFREDQPRLPYENFYYVQEDILFEAAERRGFTWSVHRPHTVIGWALGNAMNMGVTLAVYGTICRETDRPFVFPGSPEQYNAVTDMTDARLLARHLEWAATEPAAANQALNIVDGDVFRWRRMWEVVAAGLGVESASYPGQPTPLEEQMVDAAPAWADIVASYRLAPYPVERLASWWHTDADLGRTLETFTAMNKSRELGFKDFQDTERSFLDLFEQLRNERVIPPLT